MRQILIELSRPMLRFLLLKPYRVWANFTYYRYRNDPDKAPVVKRIQNQVKELERLLS
jgi:hypothetical protein